MAKTNPTRIMAAVLALLVLVAACTQADPEDEQPYFPPVVHADTRVLDAAAREALDSYDIEDGTVVFVGDELPALAVGNVIVSEPTVAAPHGMLRRITALDDSVPGRLTLETEIASLDMALESGSLYESFTLLPEDVVDVEYHVEGLRMFDPSDPEERLRLMSGEDGLEPLALPPSFIGWSFDDLVIHDMDGNLNTKNDQVLAKGDIGLNPIFDMGFALNCSYWCARTNPYFKFEIGASVIARLALDSKVPFGLSITKTIPLATLTGKTIAFSIGPVPIVIVPKFKLELRFDGSIGFSVTYEVQGDLTLKAGAQYKNGSWQDISGLQQSFVSQPVKADSFVEVVLRAKLKGAVRGELLFYGIVGIYAEIVPQVGLDVAYPRAPVWKLSAGLEVNAGITIDAILFKKDWKAKLIELEWVVKESDNTSPEVTILTQSPVQVGPVGVLLRASVRDAEDGFSCCATTFRSSNSADGNNGLLGTATGMTPEVPVFFATTGNRTITVTATDSSGDSTSRTLVLAVQNTLPDVTITSPYSGQEFYAGQQVRFRSFTYDPNEVDFAVPCERLSWSAGAQLGMGCTVTVDAGFSTGTPIVTLTATDSHGGVSTRTVTLAIGPPPANYPPRVSIESPEDYTYPGRTEMLTLAYAAIDPELDAIVSAVWDAQIDYDPATGTGDTIYAVTPNAQGQWSLSQLPPFAEHSCGWSTDIRLRVRVTDAAGSVGSDFVVLRFATIC